MIQSYWLTQDLETFHQLSLEIFLSLPQVQQKMSDIEVREMEIFDWRKKVTEAECKLKQQENLLESVVSERNLYSKNLIEAQVPMTCSSTAELQWFSVLSSNEAASWCFNCEIYYTNSNCETLLYSLVP